MRPCAEREDLDLPSRWGAVILGLLAVAAATRGADAADGRSAAGLSKSLAIEESRSGDASPPKSIPQINKNIPTAFIRKISATEFLPP